MAIKSGYKENHGIIRPNIGKTQKRPRANCIKLRRKRGADLGIVYLAPKDRMQSRIAIVDLGTNTFHLMIVDVHARSYQVVHRERKAVKIGMGGINSDRITDDALQRAIDSIGQFKQTITTYGTTQILAFGTSAIRNALNQKEVLSKINQETGISVRVISGEEEARLIYLGVKAAVKLGAEKSLIMDIGGGSVEFIIGNEKEIFWRKSFEIGAQRLVEKYHHHDPILPEEVENIYALCNEVLKPLLEALHIHQPLTLVGSSGTFDTLSDIQCIKEGISRVPDSSETPLSFEGFEKIFAELLTKNRDERMKIPGMIELRVDMIVVASCLIKFLLKKYQFRDIRVSNYSLKEGVLADIMEADH